MDKLLVSVESADAVEFLLYEVLYSLHVVVSHFLDVLHALGFFFAKVAIDVAQTLEELMVERSKLRQWQLAERDEVFDFHTYAVAYQCILREVVGKAFCLATITAVNRRDGCQQIKFHNCYYI